MYNTKNMSEPDDMHSVSDDKLLEFSEKLIKANRKVYEKLAN